MSRNWIPSPSRPAYAVKMAGLTSLTVVPIQTARLKSGSGQTGIPFLPIDSKLGEKPSLALTARDEPSAAPFSYRLYMKGHANSGGRSSGIFCRSRVRRPATLSLADRWHIFPPAPYRRATRASIRLVKVSTHQRAASIRIDFRVHACVYPGAV